MGIDLWYNSPYRANRDIILIDQRGTGYSFPNLTCFELADDTAEYEDLLQECYTRLTQEEDVDLSQYNTINNARDIADFAVALDYESYNLFGVSYGTRLAMNVMRDHPENIRSVVLDSAYPPVVDAYEESGINTVRVFEQLFNDCNANTTCSTAYPNLRASFYATVDRLNANPTFIDDEFGELTGDDFVNVLFEYFYSTSIVPYMPRIIHNANNGDFETFLAVWYGELPPMDEAAEIEDFFIDDEVFIFADEMLFASDVLDDDTYFALLDEVELLNDGTATLDSISDIINRYFDLDDALFLNDLLRDLSADEIAQIPAALFYEDVSDADGMFNAVECNEEVPFNTVADIEQLDLEFNVPESISAIGIFGLEDMQSTCAIWQSGQAPAIEDAAIVSDVPTLVLAGYYDPITPPAWGRVAAETLSNSFFYVFPGVGHAVIDGGDCPVSVAGAFLNDPTTAPDTTCIASMSVRFE